MNTVRNVPSVAYILYNFILFYFSILITQQLFKKKTKNINNNRNNDKIIKYN